MVGPKTLAEIGLLLRNGQLLNDSTEYGSKMEIIYAIKGYNEFIGRSVRFSRRPKDASCPDADSRKTVVKAVCDTVGCQYITQAKLDKSNNSKWRICCFQGHTCSWLSDTKTNYSPNDLIEAELIVQGLHKVSDYVRNKYDSRGEWGFKHRLQMLMMKSSSAEVN